MLVASALHTHAAYVVVGSQLELEKALIRRNMEQLDLGPFQDGKVIIKGCSDISCPEYAMATLVQKLQTTVQSIMYGEPCSTVPIYKRK
jgi:hypothetical protein